MTLHKVVKKLLHVVMKMSLHAAMKGASRSLTEATEAQRGSCPLPGVSSYNLQPVCLAQSS